MSAAALTARAASLVSCHECSLVAKVRTGSAAGAFCPRCGSALHSRRRDSLRRGWALVAAAAILYVPANVYPIMTVTSLGSSQSDTILSGALYLLMNGMWPLALIVFVASVVVPLLKLVALSFLLWSVQVRSRWRPVDRTRLYRVTEAVGRWSMVDIFVVAILVALVHLGELASVRAEVGAVFFGAVVVITIIAAEGFDPRLIWDVLDEAPSQPEIEATIEATVDANEERND